MARRPQVDTNIGQPEAIRTVARPTRDAAPTYTRNQSRGAALAQSLLSIAPTLQGYVQEFQADYQESEANRAYDEIQGMTYEQAQEAVKSGAMRDTESPWYQAAFEKQFGTVYAQRRKRELVDAYNNSFDKHNGNLDEFIAGFAQEDLDRFGGSEFIMSGYRNSMQGVLGQLRDNHAEWKSDWTRERVGQNFGDMAYETVSKTVAEGGDLNAALGALKGEHREAFGLTFQEMDKNIFGIASRLASEGKVEELNQLLTTEIVGPDGTVIGSYMNRQKYAEESASLLEQARANAGSAAREENTATIVGLKQSAAAGNLNMELAAQLRDSQQISLGEYESLVKQNSDAHVKATIGAQNEQAIDSIKTEALSAVLGGRGYAIQDFTYTDAAGKTQTIPRERLIEGAVTDSMNSLAQKGASPGMMAEQLSSYGVDVTYSVWENLMSDGYLTLTEAAATDGNGETKIPETALRAYATYKALAETPQLRSRHINNTDAENVWSTAMLLEQHGFSPEDAIMRASKPASAAGEAAANSFGRQEFEALADSINPGLFGEDMANGAAALGQTEALAKFYISRGVPKKQAVEQAIEDYEASHTTINGVSVNTRNVFLPNNFEDASLVVLQEFAEMHDEDVDDLTLIPSHDGSNNWVIAYKGNVAMPVQIMGADNVVHSSEIERTYKNQQEAIADAAFQERKAEIDYNAARNRALEENNQAFREWMNMSRKERKAAGLPVSVIGGQNYFSPKRAMKRFDEQYQMQQQMLNIENGEEMLLPQEGVSTDEAISEIQAYLDSLEK